MLRSPIVVIGTPRSGTSIVAKWLMDDYNVRMTLLGFTDINEKSNSINNTYEDAYVVACNSKLNRKEITLKVYKKLMKKFFKRMSKERGYWGFKDPRLTDGLPWILNYFSDSMTIIRTRRQPELVIKSMIEKLDFTKDKAIEIINGYHQYFQKVLKGRIIIDVVFDGSLKMPDDFVKSFDASLVNIDLLKGKK